MKSHSEKLKNAYKTNFDEAILFYKTEITIVNEKLSRTKKNLISSSFRKPVYSSGKYSDEVLDLRLTLSSEESQTCLCGLMCTSPMSFPSIVLVTKPLWVPYWAGYVS